MNNAHCTMYIWSIVGNCIVFPLKKSLFLNEWQRNDQSDGYATLHITQGGLKLNFFLLFQT